MERQDRLLDRPVLSVIRLNWRTAVLLAIVLVLCFSRLWDLGNRSYCHDESTHAWEPWKLITGQGYVHDPVYHGPFMYHLVALAYFMLGINDVTARIVPALFSVATVLLVWPLRRWLGRAGAIFAMILLTLSPTMMYRGRFIRHDLFVIVPTMVMLIASFRYVEERRARWLYVIAGSMALMFCAKANAYFNGLIFGSFWLLYTGVRWVRTRERLRDMPSWDLVLLLGTLALPLASPLMLQVLGFQPMDYSSTGLLRIRIALLACFALSAVVGILWKRKVWPVAAGIYYSIFIPLYTTLFTNGRGFESGFEGMLGHWFTQQGVARGGQPWYYFLFLNTVYEFLPLVLVVLAVGYFALSRLRGLRRQDGEGEHTMQAAGWVPIFENLALYWVVFNTALWTWAAEKMPWQNMHVVLPLAILAGWFLGKVWDGTDWKDLWRRGLGYALALLPLVVLSALVVAATVLGKPRPFGGSDLGQLEVTLRLFGGLATLAITIGLAHHSARDLTWGGWVRAGLAAAVIVLAILTVRVAYRLSFVNQDYATEFLVYAASTPDTGAVALELDEMAKRYSTTEPLRIAYDNESQQPFFWYLRDREAVTFYTGNSGLPADMHVVIIGPGNESKFKAQLTGNYIRREYRLIWWPHEDVYRNLTVQKLWNDLRDPVRRKYWWDILWFRKYSESTVLWPSVSRFALFVRKDVAAKVWALGAELDEMELVLPEDTYEEKRIDVAAVATWGSYGTADGQFDDPKGLAVDSAGRVYVLDTRNHRVQVLEADGRFVRTWGSQGNGPGQFQEPWGITVGSDGYVYVADTWNHRIQKFDSEGQFVTSWGTFGDTGGVLGAANVLYGPRDIGLDADGNLVVADTGNKRVLKYTTSGELVGQWGGEGSLDGQLREPCGLAVDANGNLYVADVWNQRVQKFDRRMTYVAQWAVLGWESELPVNKPYLAVDSQGNVYATAPDYHRVVKFDGLGKVAAVWGWYGSDGQSFTVPSGVAVDGSGNVYVADSGNNRVVKFAPIP